MRLCPTCKTTSPMTQNVCPTCGWTPQIVDGFPAYAPEFAHESEGFEAHYFDDLARMEAGNFWFRARNRLILWLLTRYAPNLRSFLEIGCGTGFVLTGVATAFPDARLYGTEIFTNGLKHAAQRLPSVHLAQMDARALPYRDEFDAIGAFDVLEHIAEDEKVLAETFRALKPGGILLVSVPQHPFLWSAADEFARHERRYRRGEMEAKMRAAGFDILRTTSFVSLLLPVMLISRMNRKEIDESFDPLQEFKISSWLNRLLEFVLDIEAIGMRAGINYCAGGSRVVVAKRPVSS